MEENVGLGLLFRIRGKVDAPLDAVVISIDKESSERLGLPGDPAKWPRSFHALLVENLLMAGAKVIAFDVYFIEHRCPDEDNLFARIIDEAGNIVLCEFLKIEEVSIADSNEGVSHNIVRTVKPIDPFLQASAETASLILPRIPFKVSRYWTFQPLTGDSPTLPVVVSTLYTMPLSEKLIDLLSKVSPHEAENLSYHWDGAISKALIMEIREIFRKNPSVAKQMLKELEKTKNDAADEKEVRKLKSLIKMYSGSSSQYINFYGPPRTISTIPYYQALRIGEIEPVDRQIDVRNKAVFVGLSEVLLSERKDSFYTVFSLPNGVFISGIEIAATAFLNLIEDKPVKPLNLYFFVITILFWGILIGFICRKYHFMTALFSVFGLSIVYLIFAHYQFKTNEFWYPIVVPILFQAPLAFFGAVSWNYIDVNKERKNIKKAFEYHLPKEVVHQLAKDISHIKTDSRVVYGICLITDAQQYTSLSETMDPHELGKFMSKYYETIFKPVKKYQGFVSGVIGDSVLALWVSTISDASLRNKACLAAIDINNELQGFEQSPDNFRLNTRIGLHCGKILLGHIGALDRYEYTPMGDIVNTASRLEGLNKQLGTYVLVSEDIIIKLEGFLTREIGNFALAGKITPVRVYELSGHLSDSNEEQRAAYAIFAEALNAFRKQAWDVAIKKFSHVMEMLGEDGPSRFYIMLCENYKQNPPEKPWDEVVRMDKK
jgi:adenylate cyclase